MARTRFDVGYNVKTAEEERIDNTIIHTINTIAETANIPNENYPIENEINYEGRVHDLPTPEQFKTFFDKYNKIYKEFSIRYKLLPLYYLTLSSPIIAVLLMISSSNSYESSIMNEYYYKKDQVSPIINKNNTTNDTIDDLIATTSLNAENFNYKEFIIQINKLNLKIFKLNEQIKKHQTVDQVEQKIEHVIKENLEIYDKNHETKHNSEKSLVYQKFGILNQKIQNLELEFKKLNDEIFILLSTSKSNNNNNALKREGTNGNNFINMELNNLHSEIAGFKEYCMENRNYQDFSFQKLQKKLLQDLKYWIESNFVSKSELVRFLNKQNETKFSIWNYISFPQQQQQLQPDSMMVDLSQVKELIKQALYIYNADKTGMVDFALESAGSSVISSRCSSSYNKGQPKARLFGIIPLPYYHNSPRLAIQPQVLPGECWAFKGSKGKLTVRLALKILPTSFSIEHIPLVLVPNGKIDSAIHDFSVYGYRDEASKNSSLLGNYKYEANSPEYLQYFPVQVELDETFQVIEFIIASNHGNKEYTCVYRVRVHGVLAQ